jgi:hypothetical protein
VIREQSQDKQLKVAFNVCMLCQVSENSKMSDLKSPAYRGRRTDLSSGWEKVEGAMGSNSLPNSKTSDFNAHRGKLTEDKIVRTE